MNESIAILAILFHVIVFSAAALSDDEKLTSVFFIQNFPEFLNYN